MENIGVLPEAKFLEPRSIRSLKKLINQKEACTVFMKGENYS